MLPHEGPFATNGDSRETKRQIILDSLEAEVRELILLSDYTKQLPSRRDFYEVPVFTRAEDWRKIIENSHGRLKVISSPPPALRREMVLGRLSSVLERDLAAEQGLFSEQEWPLVQEYESVARMLANRLKTDGPFQTNFLEAVDSPIPEPDSADAEEQQPTGVSDD